MGKMDQAEADGYEQGYLAAIGDLRQHVEAIVNGLDAASDGLGDFYLIINGLRNGVQKTISDFELRSVKMLAQRRAAGK